MTKLILLELKKSILQKKMIYFILLGFLIVSVFLGFMFIQEQQFISSENNYYENLSREYQKLIDINRNQKKIGVISKDEMDSRNNYYNKMRQYIYTHEMSINNKSKNMADLHHTKDFLIEQSHGVSLEFDEVMINNPKWVDKLDNDLELTELLIERNIKPYYSPYSINSFNLLYQMVESPGFIVAIIILILLFSSDFISDDFESGAYKTYYCRGENLRKIYISKSITGLVFCFMNLIILIVSSFIIGYVVGGLGNPQYPVVTLNSNQIVHIRIGLLKLLGLVLINGLIGPTVGLILKNKNSILNYSIIYCFVLYINTTITKIEMLNFLPSNALLSTGNTLYFLYNIIFAFCLWFVGLYVFVTVRWER